MSHFFARPELHNAGDGDYELLHKVMAVAGYYRVIQLKDGHWYDLPTGEYYKNTIDSTTITSTTIERYEVEDAILQIVNNNTDKGKDYSLVLTKSFTSDVCLKLKRTTDTSKLPPGENL
ncbi:MAG TPA: hypothetical protein VK668_19035 [Mucilaginibacter sp.]|nr:hypothetical protein [Mucilaginibacter sp.]